MNGDAYGSPAPLWSLLLAKSIEEAGSTKLTVIRGAGGRGQAMEVK